MRENMVIVFIAGRISVLMVVDFPTRMKPFNPMPHVTLVRFSEPVSLIFTDNSDRKINQ